MSEKLGTFGPCTMTKHLDTPRGIAAAFSKEPNSSHLPAVVFSRSIPELTGYCVTVYIEQVISVYCIATDDTIFCAVLGSAFTNSVSLPVYMFTLIHC